MFEKTKMVNGTEVLVKSSQTRGFLILKVGDEVLALTPHEAQAVAYMLQDCADAVIDF